MHQQRSSHSTKAAHRGNLHKSASTCGGLSHTESKRCSEDYFESLFKARKRTDTPAHNVNDIESGQSETWALPIVIVPVFGSSSRVQIVHIAFCHGRKDCSNF